MEFAVSREGTTLVTLHEGTDTTACDEATAQLEDSLEALERGGVVTEWEVADAEVYEHPAAPFDPYTITVAFTVTAVVEADDADAAADRGASAIEDALEDASLEGVSYAGAPVASAV